MKLILQFVTIYLLCKVSTGFLPSPSIQHHRQITNNRHVVPPIPRLRPPLHMSKLDDKNENDNSKKKKKPLGVRRSLLISTSLAIVTNLGLLYAAPPGFRRIPTQFIAALPPGASDSKMISSGSNAKEWGLWTADPGPRGVFLRDYETDIRRTTTTTNTNNNKMAPAGWKFDENDWWLEEHGIIMESPTFPLAAGRYLVTGGRWVTTVLEVEEGGRWNLRDGKLYDVTHLPCRSARYKPKGRGAGSPSMARRGDFPVKPGAVMPDVDGCDKVDYAVLFVIGVEA